jgi:cytochrome c556
MIKRIVLAAALATIGVTIVAAQSDPIAQRKALMRANNDNARNLTRMVRGDEAFDQAKVNAAFNQWAETAETFGALFPDNSKTGGETRAAPKIWQTRADFTAKLQDFGKAVAEHRGKVNNLDHLKVALPAVGRTCDSCHEQYRASRR